jgi:nucleoside-diphosphate-sugar epimerase
MAIHVVVGAGPVGSAVARLLLAQGHTVKVVTRSGAGIDGTERIAADAADAARLTEICAGAAAIYNCVNPPYDKWATAWPPIADALLTAAEQTGAVLAVTGNLYVYGEVHGPMTEDTPMAATGVKGGVRRAMTEQALARSAAGRIRYVEVRGSDYVGGNSLLSTIVAPALRKGRRAYVPADLDAPHSWTSTDDVARLLVLVAQDERAWGQVWHVPSTTRTVRELVALAAAQLGAEAKVSALPYAAVWAFGLVNPFVKELRETQHQFRGPFVLDASKAERTFGMRPEPLDVAVRRDLQAGISATDSSARA